MLTEDQKVFTVFDITAFLSEEFGIYCYNMHGNLINTQKVYDKFLNKKNIDTLTATIKKIMETVKPLGDRILVEPEEAAKSKGNIIIPENSKEKPQRGKVIEVGHAISTLPVKGNEGATVPHTEPAIKAGDTILFAKHAGIEMIIEGKKHLLMREGECFAIIKHADA